MVERVVKFSNLSADKSKAVEMVMVKLKLLSEAVIEESIWRLDVTVLKPTILDVLVGILPNETEEK